MNIKNRFLWLEGIFDEQTVHRYPTISAASNFWQKGFTAALQAEGSSVDVVGFAVERMWPFGRLVISSNHAHILSGLNGRVVGYLNLPYVRDFLQYVFMLRAVKRHLENPQNIPDYQVVFSCLDKASDETAAIRVAKHIRKTHGIPWLCIVADGEAPPGADGYIYVPWSNYKECRPPIKAIHIDGGIPEMGSAGNISGNGNTYAVPRSLMYMGALTQHGGALELAQAFRRVEGNDYELWICGRGDNPELVEVASTDPRIKLKGFVSESELNSLASQAFAFVNPRPASFTPNRLNYPSKLLHYLAFGKPVLSTLTDGVSPEYENVLVPIQDETIQSLVAAIKFSLNMSEQEYARVSDCVTQFRQTHSWRQQIGRFMSWLAENKAEKSGVMQ